MGIPLSSDFNLYAQRPLDERMVKASIAERDGIANIQRYEGLKVYVVENKTNYQLQGGIDNLNWTEFIESLWENDVADFYMPSRDELVAIYTNLHLLGIGSYSDIYYWASNEYSAGYGSHVYFLTGAYSSGREKNSSVFTWISIPVREFVSEEVKAVGEWGELGWIFHKVDTLYYEAADGNDMAAFLGRLDVDLPLSEKMRWSTNLTSILGTSSALGSGKQNTTLVLAKLQEWGEIGTVFHYCDDFSVFIKPKYRKKVKAVYVYGAVDDIGSGMVYPAAGIAVSTGSAWGSPIVDNSAAWNTAYAWGDHAAVGYIPRDRALNTVDLNTLIDDSHIGTWYQHANSNTPGRNYPIDQAGSLLVQKSAGTTQMYIAYGPNRRMFIRGYYSGSWSSWSETYTTLNFTDNSSNWNTAYGWGNHASGGYVNRSGDTMTGNLSVELSGVTAVIYVRRTDIDANASNLQANSNGGALVLRDSAGAGSNGLLLRGYGESYFMHTVGIGTATPNTAYKLDVAGPILTSELLTASKGVTTGLLSPDNFDKKFNVYGTDGAAQYGMMLWNTSGTSGAWATMIYAANQANRRISFGKLNSSTPTLHSHITEGAYFDLDDWNLISTSGFRNASTNTNFNHLVRNGLGTVLYVNQISSSDSVPIATFSSGIATANQGNKLVIRNNGSLEFIPTTADIIFNSSSTTTLYLKNNGTGIGHLNVQGYVYANYLNMSHNPTDRTTDSVFFSGTTDGFLRKTTAAGMIAALGVAASSHTHAGHDVRILGNRLTVDSDGKIRANHSSYRRAGMYGIYSSSLVGHIWSMGSAYAIDPGGAHFGNLYGLAYKHTNNTTGGTMAGGHQMVWCGAGSPKSAIGDNLWTSGTIIAGSTATATNFILSSDFRLKKNIKPYENILLDVDYKQFKLKAEPGHVRYGVIAQELQKKYPELVREDEEGILSVAYIDLMIREIAYLKNEVKQLKQLIN